MLHLKDIKKSFGNHHIFSIENLQLSKGIYWLKGINGAGKSTLLKIISGQLPFSGDVVINNKISIRKNPVAYRLLVNHSEAEPLFPSFLSGNELIAFVQKIKRGNAMQAEEIKEILQIGNYLENATGSYSSGMLKKLSLLLAFSGQPEWILLDEPLTTLDAASQKNLCELIMKEKQKGISFIITSHQDIEPTEIIFDNTFLLADKQIWEVKTTA
ncbi:MAG: ATP-binding cassette domain-containing protein [Bacteroidetes bacterium]|nr:ATP-binding cassette domain-containing protein [Bacteroidota bacterium]